MLVTWTCWRLGVVRVPKPQRFFYKPLRERGEEAALLLCKACLSALVLAALFLSSFSVYAQQISPPSLVYTGADTAIIQDLPSVHDASKYDQPVYTASKDEQQVMEAPASVTIITADEIKKYGYRTLADILQGVNGFYVTGDRNYSYLGVRGFGQPADYNTRVLLLVDGHRLNDNVYDQAAIGTDSLIDVDLIDRVEVIRGPSSSLYGTNALFGVINVFTKRGRDIKGTEVSAEGGSFDSYKTRVTYGNKFANGLEILLSGSYYDSQGHKRLFFKEFDDPTTHHGIAKNGDDDGYYYLFTKLSVGDIAFQGAYLRREKGIPTASFGTVFNTTQNRTFDEHGYVDFRYEHEFPNHLWLTSRLFYDRYFYHGDYLYGSASPGGSNSLFTLNKDFALGEWWGSEVQLTKRLFEKHKITVGTELRHNLHQDQWNYNQEPFARYLDDRRSSKIWSFYFQDEFSILDDLLLNGGVRYDHFDSFGSTVNPRLALVYHLKRTALKVLYGEAFRAPNVFEQFYTAIPNYKANPHLKPETIKTYELVIERALGSRWRATAAGYYYKINDLINQMLDPVDGLFAFKNAESVAAKGLELELEGKWAAIAESHLGYTVQQAEDQQTGKRLTNSPQHMVKSNFLLPLIREKLFAGIETRYISERGTLAGKNTSGFFTTNLTLFSQDLLKGLEASFSVYNLFNEQYGDPGAGEHRQDIIEQDGRTFWMKVKYGF